MQPGVVKKTEEEVRVVRRPPRTRIGRAGERAAAVYLVAQGYRVLEMNWRAGRAGEIDIVASRDGTVVFVEVKTRRYQTPGAALEAVTEQKLRQMRLMGALWLVQFPHTGSIRLDVLGVQLRPGREPLFEWLQDVGQ